MWTYENNAKPDNGGFWEFYVLRKGEERVGEISKEENAKAICDAMNKLESTVASFREEIVSTVETISESRADSGAD